MPPIKKKNTSLNNAQKRAICEHSQQSPLLTQLELAQWMEAKTGLSISQSTVSNILSQKEKYLHGAGYKNPKQLREKKAKNQTLESRLAGWVNEKQDKVAITGHLLKAQGKKILNGVDHDVKFSNGWLARFKKRNSIRHFTRHGEDASVNEETVQEALPKLRRTLDTYSWENIYNMDETGLLYRTEVSVNSMD